MELVCRPKLAIWYIISMTMNLHIERFNSDSLNGWYHPGEHGKHIHIQILTHRDKFIFNAQNDIDVIIKCVWMSFDQASMQKRNLFISFSISGSIDVKITALFRWYYRCGIGGPLELYDWLYLNRWSGHHERTHLQCANVKYKRDQARACTSARKHNNAL